VDEQNDGAANAARQGLHFYARCAQEAWRRSWDAANAWPPILALLVVYGGARLAGLDPSLPADTDHGAVIGTGLFIVAAWLAVFLVQFVAAPPRLCARLDAERWALVRRPAPEVDPLPVMSPAAPVLLPLTPPSRVTATPSPMTGEDVRPRSALPPIDVRLHDQVHEAEVDTTGARLPGCRAYRARVANRGTARIRRCQIFVCNATHIQVVSGPFDLGPGEHRDLPVLRVVDSGEPHALLYFLDPRTWGVADGQAAWLPEPGRWRIKVLSANAPAAALEVALAAAGTPTAWTLVEAAEGPAPTVGRRRPARGMRVADAVAEPSAGD
jgi:hypothetical protein